MEVSVRENQMGSPPTLHDAPTPTLQERTTAEADVDLNRHPRDTNGNTIDPGTSAADLEHHRPQASIEHDATNSTPSSSIIMQQDAAVESKAWAQGTNPFTDVVESPSPTPWQPKLLRAAPLAGIAALALAILLLLASYAVLAASNGVEVSAWEFEPNVYLAIFTAISNKALAFAVIQGTVVTYWLRALRGTTLAQLHRDWGYSLFVYKAIAAGRNFNVLALACICATLVAIDGPLLQRSSTVRSSLPRHDVDLQVQIVPEIPSYSTGWTYLDTEGYLGIQFLPEFRPVVHDFVSNKPIHAIRGCPGVCSAIVQAPALAVESCTSRIDYVNFSQPLTPEETATWDHGAGPGPRDRLIFASGFGIGSGTLAEQLQLKTVLAISPENSTCAANVNTTTCNLVSAIAEYPVIIDHDSVLLPSRPSHPKIVARANNTILSNQTMDEYKLVKTGYPDYFRTTLAGIAWAMTMQFRTEEYLLHPYDGMVLSSPNSASFNLFLFRNTLIESRPNFCVGKFSDPRGEIMAAMNEFMFRVGAWFPSQASKAELNPRLDKGIDTETNVTGTIISPVNVFTTNFAYFAGAAAIELFAIGVIFLTFWRWWDLGRDFSFSPLEIGKAFDAPILSHLGCHLRGRDIAKAEGERIVQYGIVKGEFVKVADPQHTVEKMAIADEARVWKPSANLNRDQV